MIPFGSQRGLGQDLATHLLNAQENERVELAHVRGAIAQDLHGAFAEWELQADTLTNCRNYLYSLSINPDPAQDRLTREQYLDYAERVEKALGLAGQPRAMVFHEKHEREHAHIVWSRIDADAGKAIHMAFDHEKLMRVTRQFARDHGIELPDGYFRDDQDPEKSGQLSLYEKHQQETTGLTKEQRMEMITALWRDSDSARAFVRALGENGYMLATGNRPYVLVDIYGDVNALPKLINDKNVRTRDVRTFLEKDFPPESLPTIEEAKKLAADHRKAMESFDQARKEQTKADDIRTREAERRKAALEKIRTMKRRQLGEKRKLEALHKRDRIKLKAQHLAQARHVRDKRAKAKVTGLAAFLGRVTGMDKMIHQVRRYRDRTQYEKFKQAQQKLKARQVNDMANLRECHRMQFLDLKRQVRAVDKVEKREKQSRERRNLKEARANHRARKNIEHMPAIDAKAFDAIRRKAKGVDRGNGKDESQSQGKAPEKRTLDQWRGGRVRLRDLFTHVASGEKDDGKGGRESFGELKPKPVSKTPEQEQAERLRRKRDQDRGQ